MDPFSLSHKNNNDPCVPTATIYSYKRPYDSVE